MMETKLSNAKDNKYVESQDEYKQIEEKYGSSKSVGIAVVGVTGVGKSSTLNGILKEQLFQTHHTPEPVTKEVVAKSVAGTSLTLYDAPGFRDQKSSIDESTLEELKTLHKEKRLQLLLVFGSLANPRVDRGSLELVKYIQDIDPALLDRVLVVLTYALSDLPADFTRQFPPKTRYGDMWLAFRPQQAQAHVTELGKAVNNKPFPFVLVENAERSERFLDDSGDLLPNGVSCRGSLVQEILCKLSPSEAVGILDAFDQKQVNIKTSKVSYVQNMLAVVSSPLVLLGYELTAAGSTVGTVVGGTSTSTAVAIATTGLKLSALTLGGIGVMVVGGIAAIGALGCYLAKRCKSEKLEEVKRQKQNLSEELRTWFSQQLDSTSDWKTCWSQQKIWDLEKINHLLLLKGFPKISILEDVDGDQKILATKEEALILIVNCAIRDLPRWKWFLDKTRREQAAAVLALAFLEHEITVEESNKKKEPTIVTTTTTTVTTTITT